VRWRSARPPPGCPARLPSSRTLATLTSVNDAVVRLGVLERDFHWHKHEVEDEFFLVLEGELVIEIEVEVEVEIEIEVEVALRRHQGFTVRKG